VKGQDFLIDKQGKEFYLNGTKLLEMGKLKEADSLFTLALCSFKNENVYYNRGISRLYLKDTLGFCNDMYFAANDYYDVGARQLFNNICCYKVDTLYYNRKFLEANKNNYKYLEEIQFAKFPNEIRGIVHQRNRNEKVFKASIGCDKQIVGLGNITTDIIAVYIILDSTKYFLVSSINPVLTKVNAYNQAKENAKTYLNEKYNSLKEQYKVESISIYFKFKISESGELVDGECLEISPDISLDVNKKEIEKDIQLILKQYPKLTPAKFKGNKVNFIAFDLIKF
jgi:tetratricopeptide (TPR) repeat protein